MVTEVHEYKEGEFDIRLEARLKNGALVRAREELGLTAKAAAEGIGVSYQTYINCEGMKYFPSSQMAERICGFYRDQGVFMLEEDIFPEELRGVKKGKLIAERTVSRLELLSLGEASHRHLLPPVTMGEEVEEGELKDSLENALNTLRPRDASILRLYYGLGEQESMTLKEIGELIGVSTERVRSLRNRGLDELRKYSMKDPELYYRGLGAHL